MTADGSGTASMTFVGAHNLAPVMYEEIEAAGGSTVYPSRAEEAIFEAIRERREADQLGVGMALIVDGSRLLRRGRDNRPERGVQVHRRRERGAYSRGE
jgi:hypothetical protein